MKIVIVSGKGGTGKSSFASSLAFSMSKKNILLVDADVDCPNQHIIFSGKVLSKRTLHLSKIAVAVTNKQIPALKLKKVCRFGALRMINNRPHVDPERCEGCGACTIAFPDVLRLAPKFTGELFVKETKYFPLVYGKLEPGESGSGRVVFEVKKTADSIAKQKHALLTIIDAPAGIGCPVIAAVSGCDYAVGVVEPTPASIANVKRAIEILEHFKIRFSLVVNKAGISEKYEKKIEDDFGDSVAAWIAYDEEVPKLLSNAMLPIKGKGLGAKGFKKASREIQDRVEELM